MIKADKVHLIARGSLDKAQLLSQGSRGIFTCSGAPIQYDVPIVLSWLKLFAASLCFAAQLVIYEGSKMWWIRFLEGPRTVPKKRECPLCSQILILLIVRHEVKEV
jgi:hypothetical protein